MLAMIGGAVALVLGSILTGRCLLRLLRIDGPAPAVGFAVLVVVTDATFSFGAHGMVAAIVLGALLAIALVSEAMSRSRPPFTMVVGYLVAGALALLIGLIPFFSNGRAGTLGVSILNDLAIHEYWAWALDTGQRYAGLFYPGYPLGAHSLVAAFGELTHIGVVRGFSALLVATPCLTALTAFSVFDRTKLWLRSLGSCLAAFPYLGAAYLGEGSFKEPIVVLCVLGTVVALRAITRSPARLAARVGIIGLLLAAIALVEGGPGLAWPALTIVLWGVCEIVPRRSRLRQLVRGGALPVAAGLIATIILVAPELGSLLRFSASGLQGSNLPGFLPFGESMGLWFELDFRLGQTTVLPDAVLVIIGLAILAYGCWWWCRRREFALPAASISALVLLFYVHHRETAYLTAKAQMIFAGLYMVTVIGPLLGAVPDVRNLRQTIRQRAARPGLVAGAIGTIVLAGFTVGVARSDSLTLRSALVNSSARSMQLSRIRSIVRGQPTLLLVTADFGSWEIRGARESPVTGYGIGDQVPFSLDPEVPAAGSGVDVGFSSVTSASLNRFRYAVTTSSAYAASAPSNWQLAFHTANYDLWRRSGPTQTMSGVPGSTTPITKLACHSPALRSELRGRDAIVRPAPVIGPATSWRLPGNIPLAANTAYAAVDTGATVSQTIRLTAGRWNISLPYQSAVAIHARIGATSTTLAANLDLFGSYWTISDIDLRHAGPVTVTLALARRPFPGIQTVEPIGQLAAVRVGVRPLRVAAHRACGRWVDWLVN